jgi:hypothetical protein
MRLPLWIAEVLVRRLLSRPRYLLQDGPEAPEDADLSDRMLFREVRGGYPKWAHLKCPKCNEHIVLQIAGRGAWTVKSDFLCRPTVTPSIWQAGSCGAHFFIRKGEIVWCTELRRHP